VANGYISKTAFLKFEQCEKAFFLYKNHYYLRDKPDTDKLLTFKRGHDVGFLARELFPGGIDVSENSSKEQAIALTTKLVTEQAPVIYEATFIFDGVLVMADILVLGADGYEVYEVKSSVKISEVYVRDACLQYFVIKNCLPNLHDFFIVTINSEYVLQEMLEYKKYFKRKSILKDAVKNYRYMEERIAHSKLVNERGVVPDIKIGPQCFTPYPCDFINTCWKGVVHENSIFNLGKVNKEEIFNWYYAGIQDITEIPDQKNLPQHLQQQIQSVKSKEAQVSKVAIADFFKNYTGLTAAFDLEVWGAAVPVIKGTKPFQKIPFLFTLKSDEEEIAVFLDYCNDDRENFAKQLIESTKKYTYLFVYDKSLEVSVIKELAEYLTPLREELVEVQKKLVDLSLIIQHHFYYHYLFKGNYSLKTVSRVLLDNDLFAKQPISTGLEAMNAFISFREEQNEIQKQILKEHLISYCAADSEATYLLEKKLINLVENR